MIFDQFCYKDEPNKCVEIQAEKFYPIYKIPKPMGAPMAIALGAAPTDVVMEVYTYEFVQWIDEANKKGLYQCKGGGPNPDCLYV